MLSIGKISAGPRAATYYTDQVASGREDYYAGEGEAPGQWVGSAAAAAGLEGEVEAGAFADLLAGGGLRKAVCDGAVAGFDLTFRAPKSVSVLWGTANPEVTRELGGAHDAAVQAALGYLEREACRARRGKGGAVQVRGAGFVAAAFRHRASRAGDPLLHTHVVVGNLTLGPNGRWTALDARHLYRHAKTAGFLYQAELRLELTQRLGLQWGPVERGTADVLGVPRRVIERFSQRRAEILQHMAAHGGRSAQAAQIAALETRRAKQDIDGDVLRQQWRARAAEHGLTTDKLERILQAAERTVPPAAPVAYEALTRDVSVFARAELLQALAEAQPSGAPIAKLERMADAMLTGDRQLVALPVGPVPAGLNEARFTTAEQLELEQTLLDRADATTATRTARVGRGCVEAAIRGRGLSAEQRRVVNELCSRGDGISVVRAAAGTGKTFVLDAARAAWQDASTEVVGCALSARAALELTDQAGIPALTIAQLKARLDQGGGLGHRSVLIVDEAGMVGTRDLATLAAAAARAHAKLVLVGDDHQLPEIQAGGAFRALADRLPTSQLHEVRRQKDGWDRQALDELRNGDVERWARAYKDHGRITVADSPAAARAALVNDWSRGSGDRLMVAARREDVADLNLRARQLLQAQGELGEDELRIEGRSYTARDRVVATRNDRVAGILNGQRGTVTATDPARGALHVQLDGGRLITIEAGYLAAGHLEHGYAITAHRAQGATVDETYVLGSEGLHRQWGYTALSRHRTSARFYIARGDLRANPELPPPTDPLVTGITQLLQRSNAKTLALDALPQLARDKLEDTRRQLRQQLTGAPPPRRAPHVEARSINDATVRLADVRATEQLLLARRATLGWRDRKARAEIDRRLERIVEEQQDCGHRLDSAVRTQSLGLRGDKAWLGAHGSHAVQLLAVDHELRDRDALDALAVRRLEALDGRVLDPQTLTRDDFDLGT